MDVIQYLLQARMREAGTNTNQKMVASLKKRGILSNKEVERAFLGICSSFKMFSYTILICSCSQGRLFNRGHCR